MTSTPINGVNHLTNTPIGKISNYVETLAANGSIFTILAISFERYYAICKPLKAGYKCTRLRATVIICIIWLLASTLTSPILIMAKSSETSYIDGSLVYNCILETDSYWAKMYVFGSMFAFFGLPLIVLMLVYWLISKRLIRENLAMSCCSSAGATSVSSTPGIISNGDSTTDCNTRDSFDTNASRRHNHQEHHHDGDDDDHHHHNESLLNNRKPTCAQNRLHEAGSKENELLSARPAKSISTFLASLHQHHYYPFNIGCRAVVATTCNGAALAIRDANEPDMVAARRQLDKRHKLTSNRALSLDQHLGHTGLGQDKSGNHNGTDNAHDSASICLKVASAGAQSETNGDTSSTTLCGIPVRKCSQTIRLVPSRNFISRLLHRNTSDNEPDDVRQANSFNFPIDSLGKKSNYANGDAIKINGAHENSTNGVSNVSVDENSSQAPFINGCGDHYFRQSRQLRLSNRGRRKLQSRKHNGLKSPSSSETYKFKWMKRFSVSSSNASVQTSSTTLPSDASVSPSINYNNHSNAQPSPRSILQGGSQSREFSSQSSAARSERKKTAHFDSEVLDITDSLPEDENDVDRSQHQQQEHQNNQVNSCSSFSGSPSSSPELSKSSTPDSMYRQDVQNACRSAAISPSNLSREISSDGMRVTKGSFRNSRRDRRRGNRLMTKKAGSLDMTNYRRESRANVIAHTHKPFLCKRPDEYKKLHIESESHGNHNFFKFGKTNSRRISQPVVCSHYHGNQSPELLVVRDLSKKQQMDSRRQVVIMLAFVVTCFFLLFFPYRVFTIWLILSTEDQVQSLGMETYYNLTYFSRILIYLHSAINPIAYNLISTKFRRAFMSILLCRGPATRRHFTTEHRVMSNRASSDDKKQSLRHPYK